MKLFNKIIKDINRTNIFMHQKKIFLQIDYFSGKKNIISSNKEQIMLKDSSKYTDYFLDMYSNKNYFCYLNDISLISGFYEFESDNNSLIKASLEYIPNPGFHINRDYLIEDDEDVDKLPIQYYLSNYIRFDFDVTSNSYIPLFHPCSHLHLGFDSNLRISLDKFPFFSEFVRLILFYQYEDEWRKMIPRKNKEQCSERNNLDFEKFLNIRIQDKKNKYIDSKLSDMEKNFYLYSI